MKLPVVSLTPWVGELAWQTEQVLEEALGCPLKIVGFGKQPGSWTLVARLAAPALTLELGPALADQPAFVRGPALALSYRKAANGNDPYENEGARQVLDGLGERVRHLDPAAAQSVIGAVERYRLSSGAEDFMLRSYDPTRREGTLRLGFRCNQDCGFCWQSRGWPDPPEALYERWLAELAEFGAERLVISGGEPTLHSALEGLVRKAAEDHNMHVCLETNALRLRQADYLRKLEQAGLQELFVSLHSHDPKVSDALTRARGTHEKTVEGIQKSLAAGLAVTLNCVVLRENVEGLPIFADFVCARLGRVQRVVFSQPSAAFDLEWFDAHCARLSSVRLSLPAALRRLRGAGIAVECVGTCGFPPCVVPDLPDVWRSLSVVDVSESAAARHEFAAACDKCAARAHCLGLRSEYLARHGDSDLVPLDRFDV